MKVLLVLAFVSLPLLSACDSSDHSEPNPPTMANYEGELKGKPIVKIQGLKAGNLAVLAETLQYSEYAGRTGYVHDHARTVFLKQGDQWLQIPLDESLPKDSFVTDIASVGDGEHLLVSAAYIEAENHLRHVLVAVDVTTPGAPRIMQRWEAERAVFPDVEADDLPLAFLYMPQDTLNVASLAVQNGRVMLVARSSRGSLYVDQLQWQEGRLEAKDRLLLSPPVTAMRIGMTGGTYDVMGQLISKYRVHSQFLRDGRLVTASLEYGSDKGLAKRFGRDAIVDYREDRGGQYVMLETLSADGKSLLDRKLKFWGSEDDPLHGLALYGAENVLLVGSARTYANEQEGRARLRLSVSSQDQTEFFPLGEGAASAHAALCPERKACVVAGSWQWSQNPAGLSISGGDAYLGFAAPDLGSLEVRDQLWPDVLGSGRSEVRDLQLVGGQWICAAGMMHGPDTHSGDQDVQRITADGFIRCLPLAEVPEDATDR